MKILITGGAGFIGVNTALHFGKNKNNKIVIVDNLSRVGVDINASYLTKNFRNIKIIRANINDLGKYLKDLKNSDAIIHLAGQTAVTTSIRNPQLDFASNLAGSFTLLEGVRKNNPAATVIYSSTNKVYGDLKNHDIKKNKKTKRYEDLCHPGGITESEELDFISPYGCSKGAADLYFLDYARIYGLSTVVFRQSCIYGEFQRGVEDQGWVAHFSKEILGGRPLTIFGDGYQVRDLLYIGDLINTYELAAKYINKVRGQTFNIGGGVNNAYSLFEVIDILAKSKNYVKLNFKKERLGDQKYFVSANQKVQKLLGWKPKTAFINGVDRLIDWQTKFLKD